MSYWTPGIMRKTKPIQTQTNPILSAAPCGGFTPIFGSKTPNPIYPELVEWNKAIFFFDLYGENVIILLLKEESEVIFSPAF